MPTMYFHCDGDPAVPPQLQQQMAQTLGPGAIQLHANSSHFPFLSVPHKVVKAVKLAVDAGMQKKADAIAAMEAAPAPEE